MRLDYIGGALALLSTWLVGRKKWHGWALGVGANAFYLAIDVKYKLWGLIPVCVLVVGISVFNAVKCFKESRTQKVGCSLCQ